MHRFLSLIFLALSLSLAAQETINNASLAGRVTDPSGAVVRNAAVTVHALATDLSANASTDASGRFRFPYLQVGQYDVVVHDPGFADAKRVVTLTVGAAFDLPIALTVGATAAITVTSTPPHHGVRSQPGRANHLPE